MDIRTRWGFNHVAFCKDEIIVKVPIILEVEGIWCYEVGGYGNPPKEKKRLCPTPITPIWQTNFGCWRKSKVGMVAHVFTFEVASFTSWSSMPMGTHPIGVVEHPCKTRKWLSSFFIIEGVPAHKGIQDFLLKYIWEVTLVGSSQQGIEPLHDLPLLSGARAHCTTNHCHPRCVRLWIYLVS